MKRCDSCDTIIATQKNMYKAFDQAYCSSICREDSADKIYQIDPNLASPVIWKKVLKKSHSNLNIVIEQHNYCPIQLYAIKSSTKSAFISSLHIRNEVNNEVKKDNSVKLDTCICVIKQTKNVICTLAIASIISSIVISCGMILSKVNLLR